MHFPPEIFPSIDNDQKGGTLALFPLISPSISFEFSPSFFSLFQDGEKSHFFIFIRLVDPGPGITLQTPPPPIAGPDSVLASAYPGPRRFLVFFFWSCHLHIATLLTELQEGASRFLFFQPGLHEILLHRRLFPKGKGGVGRLGLHLPPLPLPNGDDGQDIGFNFSFLQLDEHESRRPGSASGKQKKKRELVESTQKCEGIFFYFKSN